MCTREVPVETKRLRTLQQPSIVKLLHESLLHHLNHPPPGASRIADRSDLSMALQRLAITVSKDGGSWAAWHTGGCIEFYTAEMSLDHSREHGQAVLKVAAYDGSGRIRRWAVWAQAASGEWQPHSQ